MKRPDLDQLLRFWQTTMRLADWDIIAQYKRHLQNDGSFINGQCHPQEKYKQALIYILDPIDYRDQPVPQDIEKTLVHELGHCHMAPFPAEHILHEEQAVESYTRALVSLHREIPFPPPESYE